MDLEDLIWRHALLNASRYRGKANYRAVLGKVLAERKDLRSDVRSLIPLVQRICEDVNRLSTEKKERLMDDLGVVQEDAKRTEKGLPPLFDSHGNQWAGSVTLRFAPGPSGPLHVGHTRALILNDEYVRCYGGRLILRFEDTNPEKIMPEAYDMIMDDIRWMDVEIHEVHVQSDRMGIYYVYIRKLLEMNCAYVCTCVPEEWRNLKLRSRACHHRDAPADEQLERWERMLDGSYDQGEASVVVKTDLSHPNPAVRDFVALRIVETPHPRTGGRYRVYPTYNFAVAIDDHLMHITHVLRGKDHLNNTLRQEYVYKHLGWTPPVFIHYGWVKIEERLLKTSLIRDAIEEGMFSGWNDVRLATLGALRRRGIVPESIRQYWLDVGTKPVDITFSWENLYALNKSIIDIDAMRFFFVPYPEKVTVEKCPPMTSRPPYHPDRPELGFRTYELGENPTIYVPSFEMHEEGERIRLKDFCNVRIISLKPLRAEYIGNDLSILKEGVRIVQWVPLGAVECLVEMPDGTIVSGLVEPKIMEHLDRPKVVQFERFGFCNAWLDGRTVRAAFAHR